MTNSSMKLDVKRFKLWNLVSYKSSLYILIYRQIQLEFLIVIWLLITWWPRIALPLKLKHIHRTCPTCQNKIKSVLSNQFHKYISQMSWCHMLSLNEFIILYHILAHHMTIYLNVFCELVKYRISTMWKVA